jgi:hypothetical protein
MYVGQYYNFLFITDKWGRTLARHDAPEGEQFHLMTEVILFPLPDYSLDLGTCLLFILEEYF